MKIFISPPFGNLIGSICRYKPNVIPVVGSYTLYRRSGLVSQILKTVRYDTVNDGVLNRIGLRNAGILYGLKHYNRVIQKNTRAVLSIGIVDAEDMPSLISIIPPETNLEFNIACPNVSPFNNSNPFAGGSNQLDKMMSFGLGEFASQIQNIEKPPYRIIKMQHNMRMDYVERLHRCGFKQFHCSNSMLTVSGALSGPSLRQTNLMTIENMDRRFCGELEIIGGGGIQTVKHIEQYRWAGAEHISIGTALLNPFRAYELVNC